MVRTGNDEGLVTSRSSGMGTRPDVAIVDIKMPPTDTDEGVVVARELGSTYSELGVLVLSHYRESRARLVKNAHSSGFT
ncbi:MAG TPA: hypothetical protein VFA66_00950 [Gaiellaceae bacterium]|nr:hypothetical protein [Gaiellaceae bacterium]